MGIAAAALLAPWLFGSYGRILSIHVFIQLTLAVSYDLVGGVLGYHHLGHGLFFGIGAYVFAWACKAQFYPPLAILLALAAVAVFTWLVSLPLFRLRREVFVVATFGLLVIATECARNLSAVTGGAAGITVLGIDPRTSYWGAALLAASAVVLHGRVQPSVLGMKLAMIRQDERLADSAGIDIIALKRLMLVTSSLPAALAGCLYACETSLVLPTEVFGPEISLTPLLCSLLLAPGTTWGPLVGALLLVAVQETIWTLTPGFRLGLLGLFLSTLGWWRASRGETE